MARLYNGGFITIAQLTSSGQLDDRYINIENLENVGGIKIFTSGVVSQSKTPYSEFQPYGYSGQIAVSDNRLYICVSGNGTTGQWKYSALVSNWS
jgi:hypothetical protein